MTGFDARLEFNSDQIERQLKAVERASQDLTVLMDGIGLHLARSARERIMETNTSPDGAKWPKSFRVEQLQGGKTLYDTGRLHGSITHQASAREVEIGSNIPYAAIHQFGAERGQFGTRKGMTNPTEKRPKSQRYFVHLPWGDIPARPYLGISSEDRTIISDLIETWWGGVLADG